MNRRGGGKGNNRKTGEEGIGIQDGRGRKGQTKTRDRR